MAFKRIVIDNISQVDLSKLSHEGLRPHYGTGQAITTGRGREKTYRYRYGIQTDLGDIEVSLWIELAKRLVIRNNDQILLRQYKEWARKNAFNLRSSDKWEQEALELYICQCCEHRDWYGYVSFNQAYYPEKISEPILPNINSDRCDHCES